MARGPPSDSRETLESIPSAPTTPKKADSLNDKQRTRLFACICVAIHLHGAKEDKDSFDLDVYETTMDLMAPHWRDLEFRAKPSVQTVRKIWSDFIETGLITGKTKTKASLKGTRLSKVDAPDSGSKDSIPRTFMKYGILGLMICLVPYIITTFISGQEPTVQEISSSNSARQQNELRVRHQMETIKLKYSDHLRPKQLNNVRARMDMMSREISILLLLGQSRDNQCRQDQTFCIATCIANITRYPHYGYLDASDPNLESHQMIEELSNALDVKNDVMLIDNLEKLPGDKVMNLFQFIDKDEFNKRRKGLLVLALYNNDAIDNEAAKSMRDAEMVEKILFPVWSKYVRDDTLTSVISRISGTIVRVR